MTLTRRGRWTAALTGVALVAAVVLGYLVLTGRAPAFIQRAAAGVGIGDPSSPPMCPLTGRPAPHGAIPDRPVLGIKVENLPEARPQAGLQNADIVYEEPVEGGITRFIVLYQCHDAARVGPVRSGRITDAGVLVQFGKPLIGYAGGANKVVKAIDRAGLVDVNYIDAARAYSRDPNRPAPHNLYTTTKRLYTAGKSTAGPPAPVFTYSRELPDRSRRVGSLHLDFSQSSDVYWNWNKPKGRWYRFHGDVPHKLEGGVQVSAANVVVQVVKVQTGSIIDTAGNPSPEVTLTGGGKAYVLRDGRMIVGRWERGSLDAVTKFYDKAGNQIALAPGTTWVELLPASVKVETTK